MDGLRMHDIKWGHTQKERDYMFSLIRQIYTIIYAYVNFGYVGNNNMGKKNKEH